MLKLENHNLEKKKKCEIILYISCKQYASLFYMIINDDIKIFLKSFVWNVIVNDRSGGIGWCKFTERERERDYLYI